MTFTMEKLRALRSGNKTAITKSLGKLKSFLTLESEDADRRKVITTQYDHIRNKKTVVDNLNEKILEQICVEDTEQEIMEQDEYEQFILSELKDIEEIIPNTKENVIHVPNNELLNSNNIQSFNQQEYTTHSASGQAMSQSASVSLTSSSSSHRLPKLSLPTFSGDRLEWQSFWDSFDTAINMNLNLNDVQKFNYLRSLLTGEALHVIRGFSLTNANYATAIELLKDRYGQCYKIIRSYMQALLDLPAPNNSLRSVQEFYDTMETYIRGLESLNQSDEACGTLLVPVILKKLPIETRQNIARNHGSDNWKLNDLRKALRHEVSILEAGFSECAPEISMTANFHTGTGRGNSTSKSFVRKPAFNRSNSYNAQPNNLNREKMCVFCNSSHIGKDCPKTYEQKIDIVKQKELCFNCLGYHQVKECRSKWNCRTCNKRHHTYLCNESTEVKNTSLHVSTDIEQQPEVNIDQITSTALYTSGQQNKSVLLKTAIAKVSNGQKMVDTNILFDEGAQKSFISEELARTLQLTPTNTETLTISSFGGKETIRTLNTAVVNLIADSNEIIPINVVIVPSIATPIHFNRKVIKDLPYLRNIKLAHPHSEEHEFQISLLIGADHYWEIVGNEIIRGSGPTAVSSKLGYLLSGPTQNEMGTNKKMGQSTAFNILINRELEEVNLEKFWKVEDLDILEREKDVNTELITFENGHYTAKLPWKEEVVDLPTNEFITRGRTQSVIRRLSREPELLEVYNNIIKEHECRGFIEKVQNTDNSIGRIHYIPHHPVKKDSATTPIRIVFDCSCAHTGNLSLNDCLESTPPQLNEITSLLVQFRTKKYAVSSDIEKAFHQVSLHEKDRDVTRFFWLSDPTDPNSPLTMYRFKVVLFGATCSPYLLSEALLKHFRTNPSETSDVLSRSIYVDNVLSTYNDEESLLTFYEKSRKMLSEGGFNLRAWNSNCDMLREAASKDGVLEKDTIVKILGLKWNVENDTLTYPKLDIKHNANKTTKRDVISQSSKIFDPLGILSPVTVRAKMLMQQIWKENIAWDERLPEKFQDVWRTLALDLNECTTTRMSRSINQHMEHSESSLHIFADASTKAYGACAYLVSTDKSTLIMAKNKVAPLKHLTIPQLELMAAVIGARLAKHVTKNLKCDRIIFWSDSQIVLHWISSSKQLKVFISNRVKEIRELTHGFDWKYCPTKDNPADLLSRGMTTMQFHESKRWMQGPEWLTNEEKWPQHPSCDNTETSILFNSTDEEVNVSTPQREIYGIQRIIDITKTRNLNKLIRITCYVLRFVKNCQKKRQYNLRNRRELLDVTLVENLTPDEIEIATTMWILDCQKSVFNDCIDSITSKQNHQHTLVKQLKLFIDAKGILRCGGRIDNARLSYSTIHPILLPKHHPLSDFVIIDAHRKTLHAGPSQTITYVRQTYWIPSIRQAVNRNLKKCIQCQKVVSRSYPRPDPPPLPADRVIETIPFSVTGVDYAGPLHVKETNGTRKLYICLFTCATYRAIHIELVPDLSTESFMLAFRRFASTHCMPNTIYSDNASTFVSAAKGMNDRNINTRWKFIPKAAPWFGGWWERLIGLTKRSLKKVLGKSFVNEDTLKTMLKEIETVINDRPLTYVSSSIQDPEPLTPAHLLYGRKKPLYDHVQNVEDSSVNDHDSANRILIRKNLLLDHFVKRWKMEYLTGLREYHRVSGNNEQSIKVGDIVLVHEDAPRVKWKLAKIEELIRGKDNLIRAANIRTVSGITNRPLSKLYPLELN